MARTLKLSFRNPLYGVEARDADSSLLRQAIQIARSIGTHDQVVLIEGYLSTVQLYPRRHLLGLKLLVSETVSQLTLEFGGKEGVTPANTIEETR